MSDTIVLSVHHDLDRDSGAAGSFLRTQEAIEGTGVPTIMLSFDDLPRRLSGVQRQVAYPWFVARRLEQLTAAGRVRGVIASTGDTWLWSRRGRWRRTRPPIVVRSTGLEHLAHRARLANAAATGAPLSRKYPLYHGGWRLREVSSSLRSADRVAFLNTEDRAFAVRALGVDPTRALVIGQAVDDRLHRGHVDSRPTAGGLHLAWIGTFSERKGAGYATPVLDAFLRARPLASLRVVGAGVPAAAVRDQFGADVRSRVRVVERFAAEELPGLLDGANVVVFPSLYEGFGKALAEGMAYGLAPVAARSPGALELVRSEHNGLLFEAGDPLGLEDAVMRLDADTALLGRLAARAQASVEGHRWVSVAERLLDAIAAAGAAGVHAG